MKSKIPRAHNDSSSKKPRQGDDTQPLQVTDPVCKICEQDPTSHSFSKLCEVNGVVTFYTKPADATKYDDYEGILAHFNAVLTGYKDKKWRWIIDADGFAMKHAMEVGVASGLIKIISEKYSDNLVEIKVTHTNTLIKGMFKAVTPLIKGKLTDRLVFA